MISDWNKLTLDFKEACNWMPSPNQEKQGNVYLGIMHMAIYFFLMIALEYNLDYIDLIDENYFSNKCKKKKISCYHATKEEYENEMMEEWLQSSFHL